MNFIEHEIMISTEKNSYAQEYPVNGPPVFLLHGFPDNIHFYDYLIPKLFSSFHVIAFDFIGWHRSSKLTGYNYSAADQCDELAAVISYFKVEKIWLVAHDASGPPAINYTLDNPVTVDKLILLNTTIPKCRIRASPIVN